MIVKKINSIYITILMLVPCLNINSVKAHQNIEYKVTDNKNDDKITKYIHYIASEAYDLMENQSISTQEKKEQSKKILQKNLKLSWMAIHTLGRYKRTIPKTKIQKFVNAYAKFIINEYANLVAEYEQQKLNVYNIHKISDNMYMVKTMITDMRNQSTKSMNYLVFYDSAVDRYSIGDIIIDGLSILNSQSSEFINIIEHEGIDNLIKELQKKNNNQK